MQLSLLGRLNQQVRIAIDNLKEVREAIPQEARDVVWRHLEEFNVHTSPGREECYRIFLEPENRWLTHLRDLAQSVTSALDQVKESIPSGAYVAIANRLQNIHNRVAFREGEDSDDEEIF